MQRRHVKHITHRNPSSHSHPSLSKILRKTIEGREVDPSNNPRPRPGIPIIGKVRRPFGFRSIPSFLFNILFGAEKASFNFDFQPRKHKPRAGTRYCDKRPFCTSRGALFASDVDKSMKPNQGAGTMVLLFEFMLPMSALLSIIMYN